MTPSVHFETVQVANPDHDSVVSFVNTRLVCEYKILAKAAPPFHFSSQMYKLAQCGVPRTHEHGIDRAFLKGQERAAWVSSRLDLSNLGCATAHRWRAWLTVVLGAIRLAPHAQGLCRIEMQIGHVVCCPCPLTVLKMCTHRGTFFPESLDAIN